MLLFTKQSDAGKAAEISGELSKASAGRAPGVGLGPDSRPRQATVYQVSLGTALSLRRGLRALALSPQRGS